MALPESTIRRTFLNPTFKTQPRLGFMDWTADIRPTVEGVHDIEFSFRGVGVASVPLNISNDDTDQLPIPTS